METQVGSSSWQAEARKLRAQGKATDEIAALIGQPRSDVRTALRGMPRPPATVGDEAKPLGLGRSFIEPHAPRVPRIVLDRAALKAATAAFAAGEIDRAELMRRIIR